MSKTRIREKGHCSRCEMEIFNCCLCGKPFIGSQGLFCGKGGKYNKGILTNEHTCQSIKCQNKRQELLPRGDDGMYLKKLVDTDK